MQHKQIEFQYAMLADKIERIKNIIWRTLKTFTILYHVFDATWRDIMEYKHYVSPAVRFLMWNTFIILLRIDNGIENKRKKYLTLSQWFGAE